MKALIDSDIFQYEFGNCTDNEFKPLAWPLVQSRVQARIDSIMEATGADSYQLYLTSDNKSNFRFEIASIRPYKGHRPTEKPYWYQAIRNFLIDHRGAQEVHGMEADDAISIAQWDNIIKNGIRLHIDNDHYTLVDYEDYVKIVEFNWQVSGFGYISRNVNGKTLYLHKYLLGADEETVDHINGNKLDNRRRNLRLCSDKDNTRNRRALEGKTSIYKGVSYDTQTGKWNCHIKVDSKSIRLGRFDTEIEAARQYDINAIRYFGEYVWLNFPPPSYLKGEEETIICSRDKDLLIVPALHYGWPAGKQKELKVFYQYELDGLKCFYKQILTGDAVDNIPGLYGVGKSSDTLLPIMSCDTELDMYGHVLCEYTKRFGSYAEQFLLENARLLWLLRKEGEMWLPPHQRENK